MRGQGEAVRMRPLRHQDDFAIEPLETYTECPSPPKPRRQGRY